ncbi:MAG: UDP-N-acetylmuramate--L-alanine ligase [Pseudobdellovibrionaceae bacterium]
MQLDKTKFHFVGIGGIGMCGLAELLHNMGAKVSGSDLSENTNTERLKDLGIPVFRGHKAENVGDADVVVFSSAVQTSNPEVQQARAKQIPLIPRAEALAEIMRLKRGVAVAGTHGKTTTTSMAASIFLEAKANPTIVVGGRFDLIKSTALLGNGEWLVAEADESDGSFQKLTPEIAIITNIDSDHLDYFKSFENLQSSFVNFAHKVPFYGICIVCGDDPIVRQIFENFPKRILFYGFDSQNDLVIQGEKGKYELFENTQTGRKKLGDFELKVPGKHNALNAVAAVAAGLKAGFSFEDCKKGLLKFEGVDRRFHFKGEKKGILVYDDYGHHPTEVRAALQGFREKFPDRRLVVMFQPHRYSRTESCWHDFTTCFVQCDLLLLTDIYAAGEAPIAGITSEKLSSEVKHANCQYLPKNPELSTKIASQLKSGDVFITLGAGDGWKVGMEVLEKIS